MGDYYLIAEGFALLPSYLASVDEVKLRLGITDSTDDALITGLISQISAWIEGYTGRKFGPEDGATYTFDTNAGYTLRIPMGIRLVTSMGISSMSHQPDSGGTYTTVTAASILLRPKSADLPTGWPPTEVLMFRGTNTTPLFGTIQNGATITGNFGFAATPPEIQSVCIDATIAAYAVRKMGASGVIGMEDTAAVPWVRFFSKGSPQRGTLDRYRYYGMG